MSISFPLSIAVQLSRAETLTRIWARGLSVCWPDESFWKLKMGKRTAKEIEGRKISPKSEGVKLSTG